MENEKDFKELVLRRDLCRLVRDLRQFQFGTYSFNSQYSPVGIAEYRYKEHMMRYAGFTERLIELLARARELEVNPNFLSDIHGDLYGRINKLMEKCTEDEQKIIRSISNEITEILWLCHDPKTLCCELMKLYRESRQLPIAADVLKDTVDQLLQETPYEDAREDRDFIRSSYRDVNNWDTDTFDRWYLIAFLREKTLRKEKKAAMDDLFEETMKDNHFARARLAKYLPTFLHNGIRLDEYQLIYMIENDVGLLATIVEAVDYKTLPFTLEDYLDSIFDELINFERIVPRPNMKPAKHFKNPHLYEAGRATSKKIATFFSERLVFLQRLYDFPANKLIELLTRKVTLLPESSEVADLMSANLEKFTIVKGEEEIPANVVFNETYLKEKEQLLPARTNLILTLGAIHAHKRN